MLETGLRGVVNTAILYSTVNVLVFILYGIDKWKAVHHRWRISESVLISASVFGVFGALLGMIIWHHKTKKLKFRIGIPVIMFLEIAAFGFCFYFL